MLSQLDRLGRCHADREGGQPTVRTAAGLVVELPGGR